MKRKLILLLGILFFVSSLSYKTAAAAGKPYSVTPVFPDNQDKRITNYISINASKDVLKQEIGFMVKNNTAKEIKLHIEPVNALTSPNGVIQYIPQIETENAKLSDKKYSLKQYIQVVNDVILSPGEDKKVNATIDISDNIEGTILGAISFQALEKGEIQEQYNQQFKINNQINTIVGVQINFDTGKKADFQIGQPFIETMPAYYAIRLPISLDSPLLIKNAALDYTVMNRTGENLFASRSQNPINFTPNTITNISIPWDHSGIKVGEHYKIKGTFTYNGQSIQFEKEFTFNPDGKTNQNSNKFKTPTIEKDNIFPWWLIISITILAATIIILFIIIYRKKKVKQMNNREAKAS